MVSKPRHIDGLDYLTSMRPIIDDNIVNEQPKTIDYEKKTVRCKRF